MEFYREWCDVGTEDESMTGVEREAAEQEAREAVNAEWDAMYAASTMPAEDEMTAPDGQPF
jgi:hypothetical protein